jgi:hypothetical protein
MLQADPTSAATISNEMKAERLAPSENRLMARGTIHIREESINRLCTSCTTRAHATAHGRRDSTWHGDAAAARLRR